jgi:hypothetical protein
MVLFLSPKGGMNPPKFCSGCDQQALNRWSLSLKMLRCPFCFCSESLNRHSFLYGNDLNCKQGQCLRGQRVFCSDRGQRGGCGRTFSVFLADVLPRHSVTATLLWSLLCLWLGGLSLNSAALSLHSLFSVDTFYHLRRRLRGRLEVIRSLLCRDQKPPASSQADPLLQTVEHFQSVFPNAPCPVQQFQFRFEQALMG